MDSLLQTTAMTMAMAVTNVGGTVLLKISADPNKQAYFAAGIVAYIIAAAMYVALLKENSLAIMAVSTSTLQLGLMMSLSVWIFDERITVIQGTAMVVAVAGAAVAMIAAAH